MLYAMLGQKEISNTWIRYIYLLLEAAIRDCQANDTLFYNLDGQLKCLVYISNTMLYYILLLYVNSICGIIYYALSFFYILLFFIYDIMCAACAEFGQTILLREQANKLRAACSIEPYEVIYDPLDASVIVPYWTTQPLGKELGLDRPAEELLPVLEEKYGKLLKSVPVRQYMR